MKCNITNVAGKQGDLHPWEQPGFLQLAQVVGRHESFGKKASAITCCAGGLQGESGAGNNHHRSKYHPKYTPPFPPIQKSLFHTAAKLGFNYLGLGIDLSLLSLALMLSGV